MGRHFARNGAEKEKVLTSVVPLWYLDGTATQRRREKLLAKEREETNENEGPNDFHVYFKPSTARWLRRMTNEDEPTVPAVVRAIVEAAQRRAEGKG